MPTISDTRSLARFCDSLRGADFIAVDTEFMRERTYWPILCLAQVAGPRAAAAIDALAPGIDLAPLLALLADEQVLKVFHAGARQDIEIFFIFVRGRAAAALRHPDGGAAPAARRSGAPQSLQAAVSGSDPLILQDNALDARRRPAARCKVFSTELGLSAPVPQSAAPRPQGLVVRLTPPSARRFGRAYHRRRQHHEIGDDREPHREIVEALAPQRRQIEPGDAGQGRRGWSVFMRSPLPAPERCGSGDQITGTWIARLNETEVMKLKV